MTFITKMVRFTLNSHKDGRIFVELTHHTLIQYINPWLIKFPSLVHVTCLFHLTHVEETIIIFKILLIDIDKCQRYTFKPCHWHIIINYEGHTFRYTLILCWPPVPLVGNSNTGTYVETTYRSLYRLSKAHWMYEKLIGFVMITSFR